MASPTWSATLRSRANSLLHSSKSRWSACAIACWRAVRLTISRSSSLRSSRLRAPNRMQFDLVIFNCDGVLIDSELLSVRTDIECLAEEGIAISQGEILERYTGISMAGMLADIEARYGRALPDFAARHQQRLRPPFDAD